MPRRRPSVVTGLSFALSLAPVAAAPLVLVAACSGSTSTTSSGALPDPDGGSRIDGPIQVSGPCRILVDAPPLLAANHVPNGSPVAYSSNPPSSGPHYPEWAAFQTFPKPVPRPYYVHDMEHGGVVLLYKCDTGDGCASTVSALEAVAKALPADSSCDPGVRVRVVVTPDPLLDVPIAAAAWGWTYRADCVDFSSLLSFARDHYGMGPESTCGNGITQF